MNLSDITNNIKNADLQNIDLSRVKSILWGKPKNIIFSLMIIITSVISWKVYNQNVHRSQVLANDIPELNKKLTVIEKQNSLKKAITELIKSSPTALSADAMINFITETAGKNDLQIISLSPAKVTKDDLTESTSIEFDVTSNDYKSIVLFVKELESSAYAIKIQNWEGRLEDNMSRSRKNIDTESAFIAKIEIVSVKLHE